MKKALISYSAGTDSTFCAYLYKSMGYQVTLGIFDDGPCNIPDNMWYNKDKPIDPHNFSEEYYFYANYHCKNAGFNWIDVRFPNMNSITARNAKPGNKEAQFAEGLGLSFYVGFKQIMATLLMSVGAAHGYDVVVFGHMPYNSHYKDELPEQFKKLYDLMEDNYGDRVGIPQVKHPLYEDEYNTKEKVIKASIELGVPLDYTYSCRRGTLLEDGRYKHCRTCENCLERTRAFNALNMEDPAL